MWTLVLYRENKVINMYIYINDLIPCEVTLINARIIIYILLTMNNLKKTLFCFMLKIFPNVNNFLPSFLSFFGG